MIRPTTTPKIEAVANPKTVRYNVAHISGKALAEKSKAKNFISVLSGGGSKIGLAIFKAEIIHQISRTTASPKNEFLMIFCIIKN